MSLEELRRRMVNIFGCALILGFALGFWVGVALILIWRL